MTPYTTRTDAIIRLTKLKSSSPWVPKHSELHQSSFNVPNPFVQVSIFEDTDKLLCEIITMKSINFVESRIQKVNGDGLPNKGEDLRLSSSSKAIQQEP